MRRITDRVTSDVALAPASLAGTNITGRYFPVAGFRTFRAVAIGGAVAGIVAGKVFKVELLQATSAAGGSAKACTGTPSAQAEAGVDDARDTLTLATVLATEAVTINGLTFTAHATVTTKSSRQFSISGADTADAVELAACINDPQYGVPGVLATSAGAVITLTPSGPDPKGITVTNPAAGTITVLTTEMSVIAEVTHKGFEATFGWVAAKVTNDATFIVGAVLERGNARVSLGNHAGKVSVV